MGDYQPLLQPQPVDYAWAFWLLMAVIAGAIALLVYIVTRRID